MWHFSFQLGLATLFVTTWLFAAVEGYLIDNFLLCKHNISVTSEVLCTRYNDYTDSCRTIIEIAKCLVEQACLYCSAEVAKRYAEWKVEMTRSKLKNKCDQREYHDMAKEMSDQCPDNRFTVILIGIGILVAVLVLLILASLAIWYYYHYGHRQIDMKIFLKQTIGYNTAKKTMKSTTMSSTN